MALQVLAGLDPARYQPHALHSSERMWPETNCYLDLWIEVLSARALPPEAMMGFAITQDFEGDQFTFFKVPLEDLESLYGIKVTELAIFDAVEHHIAKQVERGRLCLVEMDSYFMPDTRGVAYKTEHGKTTVAINRLDPAGRTMDYFHNGGFFSLSGDDYDGIFQKGDHAQPLPFLPYTEFAKFPETNHDAASIRAEAWRLLGHHLNRRPADNPVAAFAKEFPAQVAVIADRDFGFFHKYAFNTLRQLGANFELAGSHYDWLSPDLAKARDAAWRISETAKSAQFQLARAITRRKFEPLATCLDPAIAAWDELVDSLTARFA